MSTINGTNGDDLIDESAATSKVKINGKDGNDTLIGGSDKDDIKGGDGDDTIDGGDGEDDIKGGKGKDTILGGRNDDKIKGEDGDDFIDGGTGDDDIDGGKGNDTIEGGAGNDDIKAGDGDDVVGGGDGDDDIDAGKGNDTITGGEGDDTIDGDKGDDTVVYSGSFLDFTFSSADDDDDDDDVDFDEFVVTDTNTADGDEGTDLLKDIETLQFDDVTIDLTGGNNAPAVIAQEQTTGENTVLGFAIAVYDFDGDTAVLASFGITGGGTLTTTGAPTALPSPLGSGAEFGFSFDPGTAYDYLAVGDSATETVTVTFDDGNGGVTTQTFDLVVTGVNDAPVALAITGAANEDGPAVDLTADFTDVDASDSHTYSVDDTGTLGMVVSNGDGTFTYDPNGAFESLAAGETATDTFTYIVNDGNGGTATETATVTVTGENDAPVAQDIAGAANEDGPTVDLTADFTDVDTNDTHTYSVDDTGTVGTVVSNGDGTFTYDPNGAFEALAAGDTATDTFTYTVDDGNGGTATATATVTITGENDAPVAQDIAGAANEDGPTVDLTADFTDVDVGDTHTYSVDDTGTQGTVVSNGDGTFTYDPNGAFESLSAGDTATDTFTYTVDDGNGGTATATATVTITGENDAPVAQDIAGAANEDGPTVDLTADFTDIDANDTHTYSVNDTSTLGSVISNGDGTFTYDPNGAFEALAAGDTATDTFTYTVDDGNGGTATATATVTIIGENDAPGALVTSFETVEDLAVASINLNSLVGDVDAGDLLTISGVSVVGNTIPISVVNGIVSFDTTGFNSLSLGDVSTFTIQYTVTDDSGAANDSSVQTLTVNINGVNDRPVAEDTTATADETTGAPMVVDLAALSSDPDANDTLSYSLVAILEPQPIVGFLDRGDLSSLTLTDFTVDGTTYAPGDTAALAEGVMQVNADGSYEFRPALNYVGPVPTVTYTATGEGNAIVSTRGTTVTGVLDTADGFDVTTFEVNNQTFTAGTAANVGGGGTLTVNADGSYTLESSFGFALTLAVTLNVAGSNDLTLEADGALRTLPPVPFDLTNGVLTIDAVQFGLDAGETGEFVVQYAATDDSGAENDTDIGEITVTVIGDAGDPGAPDNARPVAGDAVVEGDDETVLTIDLLELTSDEDVGDELFIETVTVEAEGREDPIAFTLNAAGELIIDPAQFELADGEELTLSVSYTVNDGSGEFNATDTGNVDIVITGVPVGNANNAPEAENAVRAIDDDVSFTIDLRQFISDEDGDTLSISGVAFGDGEGGEIEADFTINDTGTVYEVTFDPAQFGASNGETITVTLGYQVDDGTGAPNSSTTGLVTFDITDTGGNAAPVAGDQTFEYATPETPAVSFDLDDFISDPDGDTVTVDAVRLLQNGVLVATQPSLFPGNFLSNVDFTQLGLGEDDVATLVLEYDISDGNGGFDTGEITFELSGNSAPTAAPLTETYNLDVDTGNITFDLGSVIGDVDPGDVANLAITIDGFTASGEEGETPVIFTNTGGIIELDPTQFGVADGEDLTATLVYTVDDGAGQFNSQTIGTVNVVVTNPLDDPNITLDFEEFSNPNGLSGAAASSQGFVFGGGAQFIETDELPVVGGNGRPGSGMVVEQGLLNGQTTDPGDNVLVVGPGDENQPFSINGIGATVPTPTSGALPLETFGEAFDLQSISLNGAYNDGMEVTITAYRAAGGPGSFTLAEVDSFVFTVDASTPATMIDFTTFTGAYDDPLTAAIETYAFENIVKVEFEITDPGTNAGVGGPGDLLVIDDVMIIV